MTKFIWRTAFSGTGRRQIVLIFFHSTDHSTLPVVGTVATTPEVVRARVNFLRWGTEKERSGTVASGRALAIVDSKEVSGVDCAFVVAVVSTPLSESSFRFLMGAGEADSSFLTVAAADCAAARED